MLDGVLKESLVDAHAATSGNLSSPVTAAVIKCLSMLNQQRNLRIQCRSGAVQSCPLCIHECCKMYLLGERGKGNLHFPEMSRPEVFHGGASLHEVNLPHEGS